MFTKNYYAALATAFMNGFGSSGANAVDYQGVNRTMYKYIYEGVTPSAICAATLSRQTETYSSTESRYGDLRAYVGSDLYSYGYVYFGTGTTPATLDDYKLESIITSGISISEQSETSSLADNVITKKATYILKNNSSSDITIGEIGIYKYINYGSSSNASFFLLERTVLDEPITIPADGTGTVNYTIKIQVPAAPTE